MGWAVWRSAEYLPDDLVFRVDYLGGTMPTFALNFSRPGSQVAAQYYVFLRLGREGFRQVQQASRDIATHLAHGIEELGDFRLLTRGDQLPAFAFTTGADVRAYDVFDVSRRLRETGWLVPAYTCPPHRQDLSVLRIVCRNGFTRDLADMLLHDLGRLLPELRRQSPHPGSGRRPAPPSTIRRSGAGSGPAVRVAGDAVHPGGVPRGGAGSPRGGGSVPVAARPGNTPSGDRTKG